jgi:hypothetical protein
VEKYGKAGQATDGNVIRRTRFECWITKATDTHSEYVILIAFPRQQWLRERASVLRLYVHCLSTFHLNIFYYKDPDIVVKSKFFSSYFPRSAVQNTTIFKSFNVKSGGSFV